MRRHLDRSLDDQEDCLDYQTNCLDYQKNCLDYKKKKKTCLDTDRQIVQT